MSCPRCLSFRAPRCLLWDEEVPADHQVTGCDKRLPDDDPKAFEEAFHQVSTTWDLWLLTHKWNGGDVSDELWDAYLEAQDRLVKGGQKPCVFYTRCDVVHRWCLDHLAYAEYGAVPIDTAQVVRDCMMLMTEDQATECLAQLYKEGTLKMIKTRKNESLFWVEAK